MNPAPTEVHRVEPDVDATAACAFDAVITWAGLALPAFSA
jgi:hypothetical protein